MIDPFAREGRILVVGGGNMGSAMVRGWIGAGFPPVSVHVVDPALGPALQDLVSGGVQHGATVPNETFRIVVLAVKPQAMAAVLPTLRTAIGPRTLVLSIAAGKTLAFLEAGLGSVPIVRAMPNTPALIGRGITGCFGNDAVDPPQRQQTEDLLAASGAVVWVDSEDAIDAVTAVSGSGPAYVFYLAETLAAAGEAAGLAPDLAMTLARHTIAGAGEMMLRADDKPAKLRRDVTSPNGTTAAALSVLMAETDGLGPLMARAVAAAQHRARELSRE